MWVLICFLFISGDGCEAGYGLLSLYEDSFTTGISLIMFVVNVDGFG